MDLSNLSLIDYALIILIFIALCAPYFRFFESSQARKVALLSLIALLLWFNHNATLLVLLCYAILFALVYFYRRTQHILLFFFIVALVVGLGFRIIPGIQGTSFMYLDGTHSQTAWLNYSKALAGVTLYLFIAKRATDWQQLGAAIRNCVWPIVLCVVSVVILSYAAGAIQYNAQWRPTAIFGYTIVSVLFVDFAEAAFFHSLIQERIAQSLPRKYVQHAWFVALIIAVIFGLLHLHHGWKYAVLSALLGYGLAYVYQKSQLIEIPVVLHVILTSILFIFFAFPY